MSGGVVSGGAGVRWFAVGCQKANQEQFSEYRGRHPLAAVSSERGHA